MKHLGTLLLATLFAVGGVTAIDAAQPEAAQAAVNSCTYTLNKASSWTISASNIRCSNGAKMGVFIRYYPNDNSPVRVYPKYSGLKSSGYVSVTRPNGSFFYSSGIYL